jgi:hypothetical protein
VTDVDSPVARALRALQLLDHHAALPHFRHLLVHAETLLGEELGLVCTGEPAIYDDHGTTIDGYDHNGDTCPIHEWLVEADSPDYGRVS